VTLKSPTSFTSVLAAVTLQVGQPTNTTLDCPAGEGDVLVANIVVADQTQSSSLNIPVLQSFLQRVLDITVQAARTENDTTTTHPLVLVPGSAALRLVVTIHILQDAGNLVDACVVAAVAALLDARLPTADGFVLDEGRVWLLPDDDDTPNKRLALPILPIPLSMGLWSTTTTDEDDDDTAPQETHHWMVDPSQVEEASLSTLLTCVVNGNDPDQVLLLDASGGHVTISDVALAGQMAAGRAKELRSILFP
jgi:exosome complex RNA-binding protein Rrp42 (RNase PH superfamily)